METKLGQYKEIEVTVTPVKYTEDDLKRQLDYMLAQNPKKIAKDVIAEGDSAIFDFKGMKDGVAFPGGTAEGYEMVIGSHQFIPGFEEQMIGMAKGEKKDLNVTFPENYQEASLAGQPVIFEVTVHEIYSKEPAELNDEFVANLSIPEVNTVDELKDYVQDYFVQTANQKTMEQAEDLIMEALLEMTECDIPQDMVDLAIQQQVSRVRQQLAQQGVTLEQYLQMTGGNLDDLKAQLTEAAKKQVKLEMALTKIVELEEIICSDREIEEQYDMIAKQYQMNVQDIKNEITPNQMSKDLCLMKASQVVLQNAKVNQDEK